jgi:pyruvate/2-oxoglutarate dehydrogenase complex dihydrolipoamide acyltransferase (E2) component
VIPHSYKKAIEGKNVKLRPQGARALLLILPMLSSPAWAAAYGENMQISEYIVGLAALVLVVWDIARRYMPRPDADRPEAVAAAERSVAKALSCGSGVWVRIREVSLDHPFEASLLVCTFALLNFARVPFSLSAALVGTLTYISLVLGSRIAAGPVGRTVAAPARPAEPPAKPAAAAPAPVAEARPAGQPTIVARPASQPTVPAKPAARRATPAAKAAEEKPAIAPTAEAPTVEQPAVAAEPAAPAPKPAAQADAPAPAPAARRRATGAAASATRPSRRRTPAKPKA